MEQRPWEVSRSTATQEISQFMEHIHKSLPPVVILSQINPTDALPSHFLYYLPIRPSKWSLSIGAPTKILYAISSLSTHGTCHTHPNRRDLILIIFG